MTFSFFKVLNTLLSKKYIQPATASAHYDFENLGRLQCNVTKKHFYIMLSTMSHNKNSHLQKNWDSIIAGIWFNQKSARFCNFCACINESIDFLLMQWIQFMACKR